MHCFAKKCSLYPVSMPRKQVNLIKFLMWLTAEKQITEAIHALKNASMNYLSIPKKDSFDSQK